jgi:hypothetical protein
MIRIIDDPCQRIPKYRHRFVETNSVLSQIRGGFNWILLKPHLWIIADPAELKAVADCYRVGGGVTSAVLPHHRTYGSVYGGS